MPPRASLSALKMCLSAGADVIRTEGAARFCFKPEPIEIFPDENFLLIDFNFVPKNFLLCFASVQDCQVLLKDDPSRLSSTLIAGCDKTETK